MFAAMAVVVVVVAILSHGPNETSNKPKLMHEAQNTNTNNIKPNSEPANEIWNRTQTCKARTQTATKTTRTRSKSDGRSKIEPFWHPNTWPNTEHRFPNTDERLGQS